MRSHFWIVAIVAVIGWPGRLLACVGDCDRDGHVTVDELVVGVNVALGTVSPAACRPLDDNEDGHVTVEELITGVNNALGSCRPASRQPCTEHNALRNVYYGDLHVHTTLSFDAHSYEVRTTPAQAYRFAQGDAVALPPTDASGHGTQMLRLDRPLDFAAVTDHSEFLGEVETCSVPGSPEYDSSDCEVFRGGGDDATRTFGIPLSQKIPHRLPDVCGVGSAKCLTQASAVWQRVQESADVAYDRSARCGFTSFVAYEYSAAPGISTLHRNVIFRNDQVPFPTTYFEQQTPQGLWKELKTTCLDAGTGCDVLAIPHNPNESNGRMFHVEYPGATTQAEQRAQAEFRMAMEPLVEIYQHKGNSECMNGLSGIVGAPDEQCEFEKRRQGEFEDCGDAVGSFGTVTAGCVSRRDFARGALLEGLKETERIGANPFRLGFIGSTDTHNGTPGATQESAFIGHRGTDDDTPEKQLGTGTLYPGGIIFSPGGLAAVWADENSRPAIFDALRRREVFATSGTRLAVRVFGGWNLPAGLCSDPQMIEKADAAGVPMGGTLPSRLPGAGAPSFAISALRDAGSETRPGTLLQRLQVIKGWIENGEAHQQVFDAAGDANNGATVDLQTCATSGTGAESLCTVWSDPSFNPVQPAFYYVRVLESPSCRWSTYTCNALPPDQRPDACSDPAVPKTIQERAWSSPIWYEPNG